MEGMVLGEGDNLMEKLWNSDLANGGKGVAMYQGGKMVIGGLAKKIPVNR